ncbi:hypothetical protein ACP70R_000009 [Stipagrostis hirtigluma subsp. patula]
MVRSACRLGRGKGRSAPGGPGKAAGMAAPLALRVVGSVGTAGRSTARSLRFGQRRASASAAGPAPVGQREGKGHRLPSARATHRELPSPMDPRGDDAGRGKSPPLPPPGRGIPGLHPPPRVLFGCPQPSQPSAAPACSSQKPATMEDIMAIAIGLEGEELGPELQGNHTVQHGCSCRILRHQAFHLLNQQELLKQPRCHQLAMGADYAAHALLLLSLLRSGSESDELQRGINCLQEKYVKLPSPRDEVRARGICHRRSNCFVGVILIKTVLTWAIHIPILPS